MYGAACSLIAGTEVYRFWETVCLEPPAYLSQAVHYALLKDVQQDALVSSLQDAGIVIN
jgi:hypothetical protein